MKKIDIEKSVVRKFNSRYDLSNGVLNLGQQGYFSDTEDFAKYEYGTLAEVRCWLTPCNHPFVKRHEEGLYDSYKYFIPANLVVFKEEPKEKKYRPYKCKYEIPLW